MKSFSVKKRNIESWRRRKFYIKCDLLFISKLEYEAINISRFKNYIMFKRFIYSSLAASGISCFVSKNINPKDKYWRDIKGIFVSLIRFYIQMWMFILASVTITRSFSSRVHCVGRYIQCIQALYQFIAGLE